MGEVTNQQGIRCVQLLLGIPLTITIIYAFFILLNYQSTLFLDQYYILFLMIGISGCIIFMISRVSLPSSFVESTEEYFEDTLESQDRAYVIPAICPKCQTPIKLDRVWWEDEFTLLCQECQSKIKLRIVNR